MRVSPKTPNALSSSLAKVKLGARRSSTSPIFAAQPYRARSRDCAGCALKPQCTKAPSRMLSVNAHEDVRQHVASLAGTEVFKRSAHERRKVEMLFAHLKRHLNFR